VSLRVSSELGNDVTIGEFVCGNSNLLRTQVSLVFPIAGPWTDKFVVHHRGIIASQVLDVKR
jgi:hypothetical protein